jgi:serine/threonine protein phosphatase PrpC
MILLTVFAGIVLVVVAVLFVRELRGAGAAGLRRGTVVLDDDVAITKVMTAPRANTSGLSAHLSANGPDSERGAEDAPLTVYESDAEIGIEEPTGPVELLLVSAAGRSDIGRRRRRNEDCYLLQPDCGLYVVADGMGGHAGGDIASRLAIDTISNVFDANAFTGEPNPSRPRRGNELVWAIDAANSAVRGVTLENPDYTGIGTTILAARFLPRKRRLFVGHVGDSRCYRFRAHEFTQITTDHTLAASGVTGPYAEHLSRAVGIAPTVPVDLIVDAPRHGDIYMLCTDGLTKMVPNSDIAEVFAKSLAPQETVNELIAMANASGGRDNVTVVVVSVQEPRASASRFTASRQGRGHG